jgi:mannosyltransferase OCH1-like enzyme
MRADLVRYALLELEGGAYVDVSKCPIRGFDEIFASRGEIALTFERNPTKSSVDVFGTNPSGDWIVANWMIGAVPRNGFFLAFLNDIVRRAETFRGQYFKSPKHAILSLTGPIALTNFVASRQSLARYVKDFDFGEETFPRVPGIAIPMTLRRHYAHYQNRKILRNSP